MIRRNARVKAFQILFQMDMNDISPKDAILYATDEESIHPFTSELVYGVSEHKEKIDQMLSDNLVNWSLSRLALVEKTLLRIATYEIKYKEEIPIKVSINEAIDIAKEYGEENSGKFINGVLSKLVDEQ
ncbi:N utilization substance protein B [Salirhabdus euzebyi]|uniref:Transcription antitermination protein NusB n=1 Tax=Salirhabdus euzebyi TaxID=394506 RepID=A0A841Q7F6_9BACI|nr:transcription antitermination factor NusB [Salirhabdus euzebyi]MBB6454222.1 N utilization substance protein B [Salirhabdus euzebyi]